MQFPSTLIALLAIAAPLVAATPTLVSRGQQEPALPLPSYDNFEITPIAKAKRAATADIKARFAPAAAPTPVEDVPVMMAARSSSEQTAGTVQGRGMGKIARRGKVILPPSV